MSYLYKDVPTIRHYNLVTKLTFLKGIRLHNSYFIKIEIVSVKAYSELWFRRFGILFLVLYATC